MAQSAHVRAVEVQDSKFWDSPRHSALVRVTHWITTISFLAYLFDEYPKLKVILGHLGEGLPFQIWRVDHRLSRLALNTKAKLTMSQYFRENFYYTTSGTFRTQALMDVMSEVGADHVLYSVDYPYEDMIEATNWFDNTPISEPDRLKIAHGNARRLFRL